MFEINKSIHNITIDDINTLVTNSVRETKFIEYKLTTCGESERERKEFLKDVTSFANADGGDLILGIKAENGLPVDIVGLDKDPDKEMLRLQQLIDSGVRPRILKIEIHSINHNSGIILILRIYKSFMSPHMIVYQNVSKFYGRTSNGVFEYDVDNIRNAFIGAESRIQQIRNFKQQRIARVIANEMPIKFDDKAVKVAVHLIPASAFDLGSRHNVMSVDGHKAVLTTLGYNQPIHGINLDGVISVDYKRLGQEHSNYSQIYHNGIIETVSSSYDRNISSNPENVYRIIPIYSLESNLFQCLDSFLGLYRKLNISGPVYIFLSIINAKEIPLGYPDINGFSAQTITIDRDVIETIEIVLEDFTAPAKEFMRPIINQIWNAAGEIKSPSYNVEGRFIRNEAK